MSRDFELSWNVICEELTVGSVPYGANLFNAEIECLLTFAAVYAAMKFQFTAGRQMTINI